MDIAKKTKITNTRQFSSGINKINVKGEWNKIAEELNVLGPPSRNGEGWMKVWADYKFKIKKKLTLNKAECRATGGGYFKQYVLSPTEEAASNLLQINSIVNAGDGAFGIKRSSQNKNCDTEEDIPTMIDALENNEPVCSNQSTKPKQHNTDPKIVRVTQKTPTNTPIQNYDVVEEVCLTPSLTPSTKKTPTKKKTKDNLLDEQLEVQAALYTKVKNSLAEIERYQRKNFKIKEEKLALYKNELKSKEEFRRELLKLRKEEIQIEKRRIAIDEIRNGIQSIEIDESL